MDGFYARAVMGDLGDLFLPIVVVLIGAVVQGMVGFGSSLVAMPLLAGVLGVTVAAPLMVLLKLVLTATIAFRYRRDLRWAVIGQLFIGALFGAPLGVLALRRIPETLVLLGLGAVLVSHALYALLGPRMPELRHAAWGYLAGFLTGLLAGAYGIFGPPIALYGACCRWSPQEFKGTIQVFFFGAALITATVHAFDGNFTPNIGRYFVLSIPAVLLGTALGAQVDRVFAKRTELFRRLVWGFIFLLGVRLIVLSFKGA